MRQLTARDQSFQRLPKAGERHSKSHQPSRLDHDLDGEHAKALPSKSRSSDSGIPFAEDHKKSAAKHLQRSHETRDSDPDRSHAHLLASSHYLAASHHSAAAAHHEAASRHLESLFQGSDSAAAPTEGIAEHSQGEPQNQSSESDDSKAQGDAESFVKAVLADPDLAHDYSKTIQEASDKNDPDILLSFLHSKGFETTPSAIKAAFDSMRTEQLTFFTGIYGDTALVEEGHYVKAPYLIVQNDGKVNLGGAVLQDVKYENSVLSWTFDKNKTAGQIKFTNIPGPAKSENDYVGNLFSGTLQSSKKSKATSQFTGKIGKIPAKAALPPSSSGFDTVMKYLGDLLVIVMLGHTLWGLGKGLTGKDKKDLKEAGDNAKELGEEKSSGKLEERIEKDAKSKDEGHSDEQDNARREDKEHEEDSPEEGEEGLEEGADLGGASEASAAPEAAEATEAATGATEAAAGASEGAGLLEAAESILPFAI